MAYRRSPGLIPQELAQTFPPSRNATPPRLPLRIARISDVNASMELPPIGRPDPLSGLTSNRPHPRMLVAPPRKNSFENGINLWSLLGGAMLPIWRRLANTTFALIGK